MSKKLFLVAAMCFAVTTGLRAQDSVELVYKGAETLSFFESSLLEYQNLEYFRITADSSVVAPRRVSLTEVICRDGEFTRNELIELPMHAMYQYDYLFFARTLPGDSVEIFIRTNRMQIPSRKIALHGATYNILMETFSPPGRFAMGDYGSITWPVGEEIPVIAFTPGLLINLQIQGPDGKQIVVEGTDYCGLRDAGDHPREWYEKHGIKNYIYYTVKYE